jgi:hypothetical protein
MDIEKYKKDSENFLSRIEKEYYLHFSGQKDSLNLSDIYNEYDSLFLLENFNFFKDLKDRSLGEDKKRASYLLKFYTECYLERQVKDLVDKMAEEEAKATVEIEGEKVPFRYSEVLLSNEPNRKKRDVIDYKRNQKVAQSFNINLIKYWKTVHKHACDLGFSSYRELFSFLKDEDFNKLESEMEKLLSKTRDLYDKNFGNLLEKELGIGLEESKRSDFSFFKRAKKYDIFFKKGCLVDLFRETLSGMGIDLDKQSNIYLDVEERKNKSPRAFCCTVCIPQEIYLVVMPTGGQDDYEAMFHEGGHAQHFASTKSSLEFEYKFLGDNAVTEGYAFCLEHLMQNKSWLVDMLRMNPATADEFVYFSNTIKLWFCRRYAAKLKYELKLQDGTDIEGKDELYSEILTSSNLMEWPSENYLKDVDEAFYCTNYIRAWIFEAQLNDYMLNNFGCSWYKKKKAGDFLRELWSYGQKYNVQEILSQLGYKELNINYLIDQLVSGIAGGK